MIDIIIIALIIGYSAFVLYNHFKKKKNGGCGCSCSGCSGCSSCSNSSFENIYK
ncbi:FeoB-associated Cys-rich membrane protein [Anaerofustis sp. HA2171]|uniref:FeoB-associated Cys-rich membrane protein n=1 Tax=Anaerofustis butyriciformans TaxID=3108533 RepID=UPI002E2EA3FF|nr:FeoB-associated Cys-rich membrane protein [Anaerofustis sp. HA2171]